MQIERSVGLVTLNQFEQDEQKGNATEPEQVEALPSEDDVVQNSVEAPVFPASEESVITPTKEQQENTNLKNLRGEVDFIHQNIGMESPFDTLGADVDLTEPENVEPTETFEESEVPNSPEAIKAAMTQLTMDNLIGFQFIDGNQEPIDTRVYGEMAIMVLEIEDVHTAQQRARMDTGDIEGLRESIRKYGQLKPILVTKLADKYLLVNGIRRLEALRGLGQTQVIALVDTTIPPELVKYYEVIANASKAYTFSEQLAYGTFFKETQPTIGYDTVENALGMQSGEFLKALYVQYYRERFPQFYDGVEKGKLSITQAMKKIEKEIEKEEKASAGGVDELNSGEMDDQLRSTDELALTTPNVDAGNQSVSDRKILDPILRRSIEQRDEGTCQCCGFGKGEPDFMGVFQVHHIVPVMFGGSDNKWNLILLCTNCHKLVHDYERGQFLPETDTYSKHTSVKKIVVLGNMLQLLRKKALDALRRDYIETYRVVNRGKMGLGKAIEKVKLKLEGEADYDGSPYQKFNDVTKDLAFGGALKGDLGRLNTLEDDEDIDFDLEEDVVKNEAVESVE